MKEEQKSYYIDAYSESLFKYGEELCGDMVNIVRKKDETVLVLADGLGSGVKANILSTLTSRIISTMMSGDADLDDCVETISKTLPVCSERGVAYSTFTIIRVKHSGEIYTAEFDGPELVLVRNGVIDEPEKTMRNIYGKDVWECSLKAEPGDMIVAFSDGVIHAGVGSTINLGWKRLNVIEFIQRNYRDGMSAREMTRDLVQICDQLYESKPGDDTTVLTVRVMERNVTRVMVGPPGSSDADREVVEKLLTATGKKIVCGGTTSLIVARELGTEAVSESRYVDPDIPPIGHIPGIDLVTEGVITLAALERILQDYMREYKINRQLSKYVDLDKKDAATLLARMLLDDCSEIVFMIGAAYNPDNLSASGEPPRHDVKYRIVSSIAELLRSVGKVVRMEYH